MVSIGSQTQLKLDIIERVSKGKIRIEQAGKWLQKSRRTIERYLKKYRRKGILFVNHGNKGRSPVNKIPDALKNKVQSFIKEKYYDLNLTHLKEILEAHEKVQVKRETLRHWAHEIHHVKKAKKRRARIRKRRDRMSSSGLLLQMDGSTHKWFGNSKSCLIATIDDASSELHGGFFDSETTQGCMKVLKEVLLKKGIFKALYVDRAGIFGGPKRCHFSQVQRALEELGIEIIFAHSPEGKGRIERAFGTLQDRLIPEMRLRKIQSMEQANRYFKEVFIPEFWNKKMRVQPEISATEYSPLLDHQKILNEIFVVKEYRKVRLDHTFSYKNYFYLIKSPLKSSLVRQKVEIRESGEKGFQVYFRGKELSISQVSEPRKASSLDLEVQRKLDALSLANKLGNVSEAARRSGFARQSLYNYGKLLKDKGIEGLKKDWSKDHHHKNKASQEVEKTLIDFSLKNPHLGQIQISLQMKKIYQIEVSPGGVRRIWLRHGMNTMLLRIEKQRSSQPA